MTLSLRLRHQWRRCLVALGVLTLGAAVPAASSAQSAPLQHGIVMHQNGTSHSFVLALKDGQLLSIHVRCQAPRYTRCSPMPWMGEPVDVRVRELANGTFIATSQRDYPGTYLMARLRGTVTFRNRHARMYVLSTPGASIFVHSAWGHPLPRVGDVVIIDAKWASDQTLYAADLIDKGQTALGQDLEGRVLSVDAGAQTVTLAAYDDANWNGWKVSAAVPADIALASLRVGEQAQLQVRCQSPTSAQALTSAACTLTEASNDANNQSAQSSPQGARVADASGF